MNPQSTSTDHLNIRAATRSDAAVIYAFLCALEELILDQTAFLSVFYRNLSNPAIHYLVAERRGEVIGFGSCHVQYLLHHCGKVGEIQELFVRPDVRRQQVGQQLVAAFDKLAAEENLINLEVTTNEKRMDTIRFYEQVAFKRTHVKLVKPVPGNGY